MNIISEAKVVPKKLEKYLKKHSDLEKKLSKHASVHFYSTDRTDNFQILGSKFFGRPIRVEKAALR
jgi:glutamate racemase